MKEPNQSPQIPEQPQSSVMEDLRPLADAQAAHRATQEIAADRLAGFQMGVVHDGERTVDVDYAALHEDLQRKAARRAAAKTPLWRSAIDSLLRR